MRTIRILACATVGLGAADAAQTSGPATAVHDFDIGFSEIAGGSGSGQARDVFVDRQGNVYMAGGDDSADFPVTFGPGPQGSHDAFVVVLGPDGSLLWSRTLGGPSYDRAYAIEVDEHGYVYVAGRAGAGFPTTPGSLQPNFGGDQAPNPAYGPQDGFIVKLSPRGDEILWSTYVGEDDAAFLRDIDIDGQGGVYLALWPVTSGCPYVTSGAFQTQLPSGPCGVVAKVAQAGNHVEWGTYLGGTDGGYAMGNPSIRVERDGSVVVSGGTGSNALPTSAQAFDRSLGGPSDIYVARLRPDGSRLVFGTYLGGSAGEYGDTHNLALDADGNIIVAATTLSADFPATPGAAQRHHAGNGGQFNQLGDGFVALLAADGSQLLAATFLGGSSGEGIEGVAVDERGAICVAGGTYSSDISWAPRANPSTDHPEAFAAVLAPDLGQVVRGIALGGSDWDLGLSIAAGSEGVLAVVGETKSNDLPIVGAWVRPLSGPKSAFAVRLIPTPPH